MSGSYGFKVPVGLVALSAPPPAPAAGDTYFDLTSGVTLSWDGTEWVGNEVQISTLPPETGDLWINPVGIEPLGGFLSRDEADARYARADDLPVKMVVSDKSPSGYHPVGTVWIEY